MRTTIAALIAALLTLPCLAEHNEEPEYGFYQAEGGVTTTYRMQDLIPYVSFMAPVAVSTFTLPDVNEVDDDEVDIDLRVTIGCAVWPSTMDVLYTNISFVVDPYYRERRSVDDEVVFRLKTRTARRTLEDHEGGLRFFTLTSNSEYVGSNFVHDERLMEDVLEDLMLEGRITVELEDDGDDIEFIVVARPAGHATQNVFDAVSRCYYGSMHEGAEVVGSDVALQAAVSQTQSEQSKLKKQFDAYYKSRFGLFRRVEVDH